MPQIVTTQSIKKTKLPYPLRAFNRISSTLGLSSKLTVDSLIKSAKKKEGLNDFGEDNFLVPLNILINSLETEAHLHPWGRFITKVRLEGLLRNRLRMQYFFRKHPEILKIPLKPPVFIVGLQRTGTTKLQRLLGSVPNALSIKMWEAQNPAPFLNQNPNKTDKRIAEGKKAEKALQWMAKEYFAIHASLNHQPEEEVVPMDGSFLTTLSEATYHVPTYAKYVDQANHLSAYQYFSDLLHLLQWQKTGSHWILKTPHHLEFLPSLFQVFPNAKIIWMHRHPNETLSSFCNMIYALRKLSSNKVDMETVRNHWANKCARMVSKGMESREQIGEEFFLDIAYSDLLAKPIEAIQEIYDFAGLPFDVNTRESISETLKANKQHRYGIHQHSLKEVGLTEKWIEVHFEKYLKRFEVYL